MERRRPVSSSSGMLCGLERDRRKKSTPARSVCGVGDEALLPVSASTAAFPLGLQQVHTTPDRTQTLSWHGGDCAVPFASPSAERRSFANQWSLLTHPRHPQSGTTSRRAAWILSRLCASYCTLVLRYNLLGHRECNHVASRSWARVEIIRFIDSASGHHRTRC